MPDAASFVEQDMVTGTEAPVGSLLLLVMSGAVTKDVPLAYVATVVKALGSIVEGTADTAWPWGVNMFTPTLL
jgi:hypothetical protein